MKKKFVVGVADVYYTLFEVFAENEEEAKREIRTKDSTARLIDTEYSHELDEKYWKVEEVK